MINLFLPIALVLHLWLCTCMLLPNILATSIMHIHKYVIMTAGRQTHLNIEFPLGSSLVCNLISTIKKLYDPCPC